jgi:hypothetical protein
VIGRIVGHVVNDTMTSRYGDVPDIQVREAAEKVASRIAELLETSSNVANQEDPASAA